MTIRRRSAIKAMLGLCLTPMMASRVSAAQEQSVYSALALQVACDAVNQDKNREDARSRMMASIKHTGRFIAGSKAFVRSYSGTDLRLIVLPEYYLTGFPMGESLAEWRDKAAVDPDGPEYEKLFEIAQRNKIYLAGNLYETDPAFPELYFQVCSIIAPNGNTILRYRRLISLYTPTPYDVWDMFLDVYGADSLFPVAHTDIGSLAGIASEEILYPEIARCLAMRGAEIFCHSTSETASPDLTIKDIAKRARAIENSAYVISANSGGITGTAIPDNSTDGMSKIINPEGQVLSVASSGETMVANSAINLGSLRARRKRAGMANLLSRQPFQLYAESYRDYVHHEPNGFLRDGEVTPPTRKAIRKRQNQVIEKLQKEGIFR